MVSFSCEACNETIIKKKVQQHLGRCHAPVTCIDCSATFQGHTYKDHNQCMTEDQKYQGKLYKPKEKKGSTSARPTRSATSPKAQPERASPAQQSPSAAPISQPQARAPSSSKSDSKRTGPPLSALEKADLEPIKITKDTTLRKLVKRVKTEYSLNTKQALAKLIITKDGKLVLGA